jgi:hypothetical protein
VPTAIVLVSKFFYFNLLKDCLSSIYDSLLESPHNFNKTIEEYAFELTNLPVPPISSQRFNLVLVYIFINFIFKLKNNKNDQIIKRNIDYHLKISQYIHLMIKDLIYSI